MYESGITVIITVYNSEQYLDKMLESVYSQTFKDFNSIIVNDGSNDNSENILLKYIEKYPESIYISQENKGVSEARNVALCKIKKKYTIFLDSDDYIENDMLEKMYQKAERSNADMVMGGYDVIYDYCCKREKVLLNMDENRVYSNSEVVEMALRFQIGGQLWNKMLLSENFINSKVRFEKGRIIEDLFPVVNQIIFSKRIVYINETLYTYRKRCTSLIHATSNWKIIEDQIFAYKKIYELIKDVDIVDKTICYYFISFVEASSIKNCTEMKVKCKNEIYEEYKIDDFK